MDLIIFGFALFCLFKKKYDLLYFLLIFLNIAIPSNENFKRIIGLNLIYDTNLILLFFMMIILFKSKGNRLFSRIEISLLPIIISVCFIGVINGLKNPFFLFEFKLLINILLVGFIIYKWVFVFKINFYSILNYLVISSIFYSIIAIILYVFFKDGSLFIDLYGESQGSNWGTRISFSNNNSRFVIIFSSIYLISIRKNTLFNLLSIFLNIIAFLLSQSRTLLILLPILIILIILIFFTYKSVKKNISLLRLSIFSLFIPMVIILSMISDQNIMDNKLISDVYDRLFLEDTSNLTFREISNKYAIETVKDKTIGDGIGEEIYFGGSGGIQRSFIDNAFVCVYVKFGFIGVSLFILLIISIFISLIKNYKNTGDIFYLVFSIVYVASLINTVYLTSQLLHSSPVYMTLALVITLSVLKIKEKKKVIESY